MGTRTTHRGWVTAALLVSMFMTAIEITIVATAMPRIVAELGGFALLSWVFSSYLLTQVVSIPIYGKLADLYGRKPVYAGGVLLFLVASVLCGQASTMVQLIAFRFLQGLGGGAVQPTSVTIIGDLFELHERHRIQGWVGSVFAISSLVGPTLGAFIVDVGHWSWIFYLNVPIGLLALGLLWHFFHEEKRPREHKIDLGGAALLMASSTALMLGLLEGGTAWPWLSWQSVACFASFFVLGAALLKVEARVKEPVFPLWIFKHRLICVAGAATFINGALLVGYSAMIPTHVQGALGRSALAAGLALAAMSIGWPLASYFSGWTMKKLGFRNAAIVGGTLLLVGAAGILFLAQTSALAIAVAVFVVGMGMGLQSAAYIITIQSTVPWKERGVATANNMFMRTLGSTVGVAAFGGILNSTVSRQLGDREPAAANGHGLDLVNQLLSSTDTLSAGTRANVVSALGTGMNAVFIAAVFAAAVCLVFTFLLPAKVEARA